ncbi:adenylosuccinate lyase [Candidatus Sumerlaeota bacterium]|nr:adenylosuccinate lyase [Candidatus Sumerlaeota bacterium]
MIQRYTRKPMSDIWTREAQFDAWLRVELAVCDYYAAAGRIPRKDMAAIRRNAHIDVKRIDEIEAVVRHDVIAFTTQLAEQIGPASRFVHLGLTSSDVVDTAWGLRIARAAEIIAADLKAIHKRLRDLATRHAFTVMMGRTHGMHAEPTTFGLKALVWYMEFGRHIERFAEATRRACVGKISGAVGTSAHTGLDLEKSVCKSLGLGVAEVSTQVIQRDRHAEFLNTLALIACSVEKVATEIRHLQRPELRELEEPFAAGQKGSSAMPHKRNPVTAEQLTGLARVVRSNAIAGMENVALWGERDISHSSVERVVIPDSCQLVDYILAKLDWILAGLRVNEKRMEQNVWATRGLVFSQKVMLSLVDTGMAREAAYAAVQAAAMRSWHDGAPFADELMKEDTVRAATTRANIDAMMNPRDFLTHVPKIFARCGIKLKTPKAKTRQK